MPFSQSAPSHDVTLAAGCCFLLSLGSHSSLQLNRSQTDHLGFVALADPKRRKRTVEARKRKRENEQARSLQDEILGRF